MKALNDTLLDHKVFSSLTPERSGFISVTGNPNPRSER